MAVTVASPEHGYGLAKLFGVTEDLLSDAKAHGAKLAHSGAAFLIMTPNDEVVATVLMKGTAITLAKEGKMGPTSKEAIRFQIVEGLKKAIQKNANGAMGSSAEFDPDPEPDNGSNGKGNILKTMLQPKKEYPNPNMTAAQKAAWTKKVQKGQVSIPPSAATPATGVVPPTPDAFKASPVKLANATNLYQPVSGTSKTYYVVALLKGGTKLAARVAGESLSVRAEGDNLSSYMSSLSTVGFDAKKDYASVHLNCMGVGVKKTYGAILGAVGFQNVISCASIEALPNGD